MATPAPWMATTPCKFHQQGFCLRGDSCWFQHGQVTGAAVAPPIASSSKLAEDEENTCSICFEKPQRYGLLDCQHVFCLECIRQWRTAKGKSDEQKDVSSMANCPTCRLPTQFLIPSQRFLPNGPEKDEATRLYKDSRKRIQCRHFQDQLPEKLWCPFGLDCLYSHIDPENGQEHTFEHTHADTLANFRAQRRRRREDAEMLSEYELRRLLAGMLRNSGGTALEERLTNAELMDYLEEAGLYDSDEDSNPWEDEENSEFYDSAADEESEWESESGFADGS